MERARILIDETGGTDSEIYQALDRELKAGRKVRPAQRALSIREVVNNVSPTLQTGVSSSLVTVMAAQAPALPPMGSVSPHEYQNVLLIHIDGEAARVDQIMAELTERREPPEFFDDWDSEGFGRALGYVIEDIQMLGMTGLPSVDVMAKEIERCIWARWIPVNLRVVNTNIPLTGTMARHGIPVYEYFNPSTAIEARFNELGITRDSGVGDFGVWTSDAEIQQVITWAQNYRPRPFMPVALREPLPP